MSTDRGHDGGFIDVPEGAFERVVGEFGYLPGAAVLRAVSASLMLAPSNQFAA